MMCACRPPDRPDASTLRRIPLLAALPAARLKLVAYTVDVIGVQAGEVVVRQGDTADGVGIVAAGRLEAWLTGSDGRRTRLWTLGQHGVFGEAAVLCGTGHGATVQAMDHAVVFKIPAPVFRELGRQHADVRLHVLTALAERLEQCTSRLGRFGLPSLHDPSEAANAAVIGYHAPGSA